MLQTAQNLASLEHHRLYSQQIAEKKFTEIQPLVAYMGALQAQDYPMAKWAIGLRLPQSFSP